VLLRRERKRLAISGLLALLLTLCVASFTEESYDPYHAVSSYSAEANALHLVSSSIDHNTNSLEMRLIRPVSGPDISTPISDTVPAEYLVLVVKSDITYSCGYVFEANYHMSDPSNRYSIPLTGAAKYSPFNSYQVRIGLGKTRLSAYDFWTGAGYEFLPIVVSMRSDVPNYRLRLVQDDEHFVSVQFRPKVSAVLLGAFLPILVICVVAVYRAWWSTAIALLGAIPFRLVLVPPEFHGFALFDMLMLLALAAATYWLLWRREPERPTEQQEISAD